VTIITPCLCLLLSIDNYNTFPLLFVSYESHLDRCCDTLQWRIPASHQCTVDHRWVWWIISGFCRGITVGLNQNSAHAEYLCYYLGLAIWMWIVGNYKLDMSSHHPDQLLQKLTCKDLVFIWNNGRKKSMEEHYLLQEQLSHFLGCKQVTNGHSMGH
jgi:hypothetical protein